MLKGIVEGLKKIDKKKIVKGGIVALTLILTLAQNKDAANDRESIKADLKKELLDELQSKEN